MPREKRRPFGGPEPSDTGSRESFEPGCSTATARNVAYRLGKLEGWDLLHGIWLDCGCADGGYAGGLVARGVARVVGVDLEPDRLRSGVKTRASQRISIDFSCASGDALPFKDGSFDGVLLNEVLEHVSDQEAALAEIRRVTRPGGTVAVISPNRWFPFEGHGLRVGKAAVNVPVPFLPYLPSHLARRFMRARNYWPGQLRRLVATSGFDILFVGPVMPVFEVYRWLPPALVASYVKSVPTLERLPLVARLGVSTLVLGQKPQNGTAVWGSA